MIIHANVLDPGGEKKACFVLSKGRRGPQDSVFIVPLTQPLLFIIPHNTGTPFLL